MFKCEIRYAKESDNEIGASKMLQCNTFRRWQKYTRVIYPWYVTLRNKMYISKSGYRRGAGRFVPPLSNFRGGTVPP